MHGFQLRWALSLFALSTLAFLCVAPAHAQTSYGVAPPSTWQMGAGVNDVVLFDANADGFPDILTADNLAGTVSLRVNSGAEGAGDFSTLVTLDPNPDIFEPPVALAVGDLDGNGLPDIAVAVAVFGPIPAPGVEVMLNHSDFKCNQVSGICFSLGVLVPSPGKVDVSSVALGDVDGDGDLDMAVGKLSTSGLNSITVHFNNGSAQFGGLFAQLQLGDQVMVRDVAIVDLNGDGFGDVVAAVDTPLGGGAGSVFSYLSNGDGTFSFAGSFFEPGAPFTRPFALDVADINGDQIPDVVTANLLNDTAWVLIGQGNGGFTPATSYPVGDAPRGVRATDVNADGKPDLIVGNGASHDVTIFFGQGDGTFVEHVCSPVPTQQNMSLLVAVDVADTNSDGRMDIVTAHADADNVALVLDQTILGDIEPSGAPNDVVDGADLAMLLVNWGACAPPCASDLNCDGVVDGADLAFLLANWTDPNNPPPPLPGMMAPDAGDPSSTNLAPDDAAPNNQSQAPDVPWILAELGFTSVAEYVEWVDALTEAELFEHIQVLLQMIQQ